MNLRVQAVRIIDRYKTWPYVTMISMWCYSRALANQHIVYNIHAQNPNGVDIGWNLAVPLVCFSITSFLSILTGWGLWAWGVPVGILSSFASLHSGFFGTFTPLEMTSCSILDLDQITTLVATIVILILQYTNEIPVFHRTWRSVRVKIFGSLGRLHRKAASPMAVTIIAITAAIAVSSNSFAELFRSLRLVAGKTIRPRLQKDYSRIEWNCVSEGPEIGVTWN